MACLFMLANPVRTMLVRAAKEPDIGELARIWYEGWHEAHAHILPAELTQLRTLVATLLDRPVGFCILKGDDELYQLYVSSQSRSSGVATALIADAEARFSERGVETAWLACAIGNERAARFYEKCGWRRMGTMINPTETSQGPFPLEVWRYEKSLI